jgi:ElaB/YqjD/DUF883 family membrane-anchored ribosome-binding protein
MENQITTEPVVKTPEQIEADMFETRESLTEKVVALENQVMGSVKNAANTLTDTVDAVKSFVATAPETVSDTLEKVGNVVTNQVKKTFDISSRVQSNPWGCMGMSAGVGFLAGFLLSRNEKSAAISTPPPSPPSFAATREPGVFDDLLHMVGRKLKEITENVIDAATVAVNKNIREEVPKLVDEAAKKLAPIHEGTTEPGFDAASRIYGK